MDSEATYTEQQRSRWARGAFWGSYPVFERYINEELGCSYSLADAIQVLQHADDQTIEEILVLEGFDQDSIAVALGSTELSACEQDVAQLFFRHGYDHINISRMREIMDIARLIDCSKNPLPVGSFMHMVATRVAQELPAREVAA